MYIFLPELMFLETSALTGENVEETFLKCARQILTKIESGNYQALDFNKLKLFQLLFHCRVPFKQNAVILFC